MLRDPNLVAFSRQHHNALALCVFIERGLKSPAPGVRHWNAEITRLFQAEIQHHFEAEERFLFPFTSRLPELRELTAELLAEHAVLRDFVRRASGGELGAPELLEFAARLSSHVRKEERRLFEQIQQLAPPEELARIGSETEDYFRSVGLGGTMCAFPVKP